MMCDICDGRLDDVLSNGDAVLGYHCSRCLRIWPRYIGFTQLPLIARAFPSDAWSADMAERINARTSMRKRGLR